MSELSSGSFSSSFYNTNHRTANNYNPSVGNFQPYITEEMQNMIKTLKIDSAIHKISNGHQDNTLVVVIDCLLYYHYNSVDIEFLHSFFFKFNQEICENPLEKEDLEDLWIQQTSFIQYNTDEKNRSFIKPQNIKQEDFQQSEADLLQLELAEPISKGNV